MSRRGLLAGAPVGLAAVTNLGRAAAAGLPRPTPAQRDWQDFEVGLIYCLDLPTFLPGGWKETRETLDPNLYQPARLDTDQWIDAAKAMGCRYAIFTATHFNGFLQWQSDLYPYGLRQTSWRNGKADVFGDFVASCRKAGIAPGVFLSCHRNAFQKVWSYRVNWGAGGAGQAEFARLGAKMTEELVSRYGPLCEVWFDAGLLHPDQGGPDVVPVVDRHQKKTVFYHNPQRREHRWIGNERGFAGEPCWATMPDLATADRAHMQSGKYIDLLQHGDPRGTLWSPAMVDVPIRNHEWFWRAGDERKLYRADDLVKMYYQSVGRNCTFIAGAVPDSDGLIPEADVRVYAEFGKEIRRRFGRPLAETHGKGDVVELRLPRPAAFDHVVLMEEIAQGERVREYVVEVLAAGGEWKRIAGGESIGHKWIHRIPAVEAQRVRLRVTRSAARPMIRSFALYGGAA
jgi:alpha-L-fucosidase